MRRRRSLRRARQAATRRARLEARLRLVEAETIGAGAKSLSAPTVRAVQSRDWREAGVVPPTRDQGDPMRFNTCSSFALVAVIEAVRAIRGLPAVTLAPGFIHRCLLGLDETRTATPRMVVEAVRAGGVAAGFAGDYPFPPDRCGVQDRVTIAGSTLVNAPTDEGRNAAAMQAIDDYGPILADMHVDAGFFSLGAGEVYAPAPGEPTFLHSVAVIGFERGARYWLVLNSTGAGWADGGVGKVAFGAGGLISKRGGYRILV